MSQHILYRLRRRTNLNWNHNQTLEFILPWFASYLPIIVTTLHSNVIMQIDRRMNDYLHHFIWKMHPQLQFYIFKWYAYDIPPLLVSYIYIFKIYKNVLALHSISIREKHDLINAYKRGRSDLEIIKKSFL